MTATHVPAWKRMGLNIKTPAKESAPLTTTSTEEPPVKKRRIAEGSSPAKAINGTKRDPTASNGALKPSQRLKKQVSFTADTKAIDGDSAVSIIPSEEVQSIFPPGSITKKPKKVKQPTKPAATKPNSALDYLTEYYGSHSSWKFNKNRETWILKNVLSLESIPLTYNPLLVQYIYGLKSQNTRDRLRLQCISAGVGPDSGLGPNVHVVQSDGKSALDAFPTKILSEGTDLYSAFCDMPRALLVRWAIDPAGTALDDTVSEGPSTGSLVKESATQKKRKNRTVVVEYSSSSESSSSDSEDSSSSESSGSDMSDED